MDGMESVRWLEGHVAWTFRQPSRAARQRLARTLKGGECGRLLIRGVGGGLPTEAERQFVWVELSTAGEAATTSGQRLELAGLAVDAAQCLEPAPKPHSIEAQWELAVTGRDGLHWTIRGSWLVQAYLGTLAGWPEPADRPPDWETLPGPGHGVVTAVDAMAWPSTPEVRWRQIGRNTIVGFVPVLPIFILSFVSALAKKAPTDAAAIFAAVAAVTAWVSGFIWARRNSEWGPIPRFGPVELQGSGGGIPDVSGEWWVSVDVTPTGASTKHYGEKIVLPLRMVHPIAARQVGWPRLRRRAADAMWELDLVGPSIAWTIRGRWIRLVQLAQLGDWWEPTRGETDPARREMPTRFEQYLDA